MLHHGYGTHVRNSLGLWRGNEALIVSCAGGLAHPDDVSMIIIESLWRSVAEKQE